MIAQVYIWHVWREYLVGLIKPPWSFSVDHISTVFNTWYKLEKCFEGSIPYPLIQPTNVGNIQLAWDKGRHYVEIDILPNGSLEWFYRDRETNELNGTEEESEVNLSPLLVGYLQRTLFDTTIDR